jgi:hypothetical protein
MKLNNRIAQTRVLILAVLLGSVNSPAQAQQRSRIEVQQIPSSAVACYFVGRFYLDTSSFQGEVVGYFTDISRIGASDSLFNGSPSEQTAFFTLRSDMFSLTSLPANGDLGLFLVSAGTYNIYYNPTPNGDWSDPDTFSGGQKFPGQPIAQFTRPEVLDLEFEAISQHMITETLVSSQSFTFKGHKYNFSAIAPGGVTLYNAISNTPLPGVAGFSIVLPYAGTCVAVANNE